MQRKGKLNDLFHFTLSAICRELHLDHDTATVLRIAARFSAQSGSAGLGLCRAIPAPSCSFLNIFLLLLLCFRMKEQEEKREWEIVALAEMINGKHFAFCLAIRPVQAGPLHSPAKTKICLPPI